MSTHTNCKICNTSILEVTAKFNEGMCAPCKSDHSKNEFDKTIQGWRNNPSTIPGTNGIPEPGNIVLRIAASQLRAELFPTNEDNMQRICHEAFDKAHDKWMSFRKLLLTKREKFILATETFYGEVTNGGIIQYLGNESGAFANWSVEAFEAIGIPEYSKVMMKVKELFPAKTIPTDRDKRWDLVEAIDKKVIETIEKEFWDHYYKNEKEIRTKLYNYIQR